MARGPLPANCGKETRIMAYVVTRLCVDCVSTECVGACPTDCFYKPADPAAGMPNMLYINPDECISCAACESACPWKAIFEESAVPAVAADDTAWNKYCSTNAAAFVKAEYENKTNPTEEEVEANKVKWGMA